MNNRLKVLRAERSWSQQDLAEHLEVSRQSVNAIETGKYDPSLPLAFRIARQEVTAITGHHESVQQVRAANVFRMLGGLFAFGSKAHFVQGRISQCVSALRQVWPRRPSRCW